MDRPQHGPPELYDLPEVKQGVIDTFRATNHDFDQDWDELKRKQPHLAAFLMDKAEKLAPRQVQNKEIYVRLALSVYKLLQQQGEVNQLEENLGLKSTTSGDGASAQPL